MIRWLVAAVAVLALAGCAGGAVPRVSSSTGVGSGGVTPEVSDPPEREAPPDAAATSGSPVVGSGGVTPEVPDSPGPGAAVAAFCEYLERTAPAQQQVEDPMDFVELVEGAARLAPPEVADDAALFAKSIRKLAIAVVGDAGESRAANRWLERNEAAVTRADADLEAYAEQACGRPFIVGEGS